MHGQASRQAHLNQMWRASECEPKSFSDPNNEPPPGSQWRATRPGSALWREIDISSSAPQSGGCLCISHLRQRSGALTDPHLHLFSSDLLVASWHSRRASHFWLRWPLWVHAGNPPLNHISYTKLAETQACIIQKKARKTADVDNQSGSTVNVGACSSISVHIHMDTVHAAWAHGCIHICKYAWVCSVNARGLGENILQMQISEDLLEVFLLRYRLTRLCQTLGAIKSTL